MSRVIYANTPSTSAQDALRVSNNVRIVTSSEEGMGVNALPAGVYGFTYSPGLPNAPLFASRRYRSYEIHKVPGDVYLVGFAAEPEARRIEEGAGEVTIVVHPEPEEEAAALVTIPYSRMRQHRQYAAPNQKGFTVTVTPA